MTELSGVSVLKRADVVKGEAQCKHHTGMIKFPVLLKRQGSYWTLRDQYMAFACPDCLQAISSSEYQRTGYASSGQELQDRYIGRHFEQGPERFKELTDKEAYQLVKESGHDERVFAEREDLPVEEWEQEEDNE